jgi:hypothetical protein
MAKVHIGFWGSIKIDPYELLMEKASCPKVIKMREKIKKETCLVCGAWHGGTQCPDMEIE